MAEFSRHFVKTNGIRMHYVEAGSGPLVVMCHGWPESWYSWRHQIAALAAAGFRAVAPDQRGYGQTDAPAAVEAYNILQLTADIVGLVNALGAQQAIVAGHDWGAPVAYNLALLRPDLFRALILLSVPYSGRPPIPPADILKAAGGDGNFYAQYFQEPGKIEKELEADVRKSLAMILYSASGDPPPAERWRFKFGRNETFMQTGVVPKKLPAWLTEADLDFYAGEFKRTGFRGGLNWYRNIQRNWELTPFLEGARIAQPAMFAAGEHDCVLAMDPAGPKVMDRFVPNLRSKTIIPGAGHWTQQERPAEVNRLMLEFLNGL